MSTTHSSPRVSISRDAPALYRAHAALDRAVRESGLDRGILELNSWNRLAVATGAIFEP